MSAIELTTQNFEEEVMNSDVPVLVDFWAPWCGPCKMIMPVISELSEEFAGKTKVGKINIDEQAELQQKFNIMTIPTLIMFNKGEKVEQAVGLRTKSDLEEMINKYL